MEENKNEKNFEVVEWTIVNFSCWNEDIHEAVIEIQEFGGVLGVALQLQLHPKGPGQLLLACILCDEPVSFLGVLSFLAPDGSVIRSCEVNESGGLVRVLGPSFDEVVSQIRRSEALLHEDQLTLKLRMRWKYSKVMLARTELTTIRSSWKFDGPTLENLQTGFNWITRTIYQLDDGSTGEMDLVALKGDSKIELRLDPESSFVNNISVIANVSVLGKDGAVTGEEVMEHVFREREGWIFWNSPLTKDTEEEFTLYLRIKIVPSVKYKHRSGYYMPAFVSDHCLTAPSYHQS